MIHLDFGLVTLGTDHRLRLKNATFQDFGPVDGAVVNVTAGSLEVEARGGAILVRQ